MVWLKRIEVQVIPDRVYIFLIKYCFVFTMNFFKNGNNPDVLNFSQEHDFPGSNLLQSGSRTQEELFSRAPFPQR
jgi:hypothetical protein